jgi:hypothetical protein
MHTCSVAGWPGPKQIRSLLLFNPNLSPAHNSIYFLVHHLRENSWCKFQFLELPELQGCELNKLECVWRCKKYYDICALFSWLCFTGSRSSFIGVVLVV